MTSFNRFKERNLARASAQNRGNVSFVFNGYNSTIIKNDTKKIQAAVVNEQEKNLAYIYTQIKDVLSVGSVWEVKTLHFLITEEIVTIKDVKWNKYLATLCNVNINGIWGRFIGPEEKYINIALKQDVSILSQQKPILIFPTGYFSFGDKIVIKNRAWIIQEYDDLSTNGISYYSLAPTTISKDTIEENDGQDFFIEKANYDHTIVEKERINNLISVVSNKENVLTTENGYFKYSNPMLKVLKRSATQVIFSLPNGIEETRIEVKEGGDIKTYTYRLK